MSAWQANSGVYSSMIGPLTGGQAPASYPWAPSDAVPPALPVSVPVDATKLAPAEEASYQAWKSTLPSRLQYEGDYDLRGFYKKNPKWSLDSPEAHMTDEFKLPNHPTFSDESRYYNARTKHLGGHWQGNSFIPNDTRFKQRVDE